ncbi:hypothetical protein KIN20_005678 [Parelaphostrongylus tenuis]|uniref:Uncharacterized protein n=1 Tax=Parelaphostrongylus tenuis TaxID=148309 RepID=A0AAD5QHP7_PARTN|nr:hypothetical protein KIN20_005678 [Parelaphostrongylus tenuis]
MYDNPETMRQELEQVLYYLQKRSTHRNKAAARSSSSLSSNDTVSSNASVRADMDQVDPHQLHGAFSFSQFLGIYPLHGGIDNEFPMTGLMEGSKCFLYRIILRRYQ